MIKDSVFGALELANERRAERRRFLKLAGAGAAAAGGLGLLSACGSDDNDSPTPNPSPTPTPSTGASLKISVVQLALNLKYLEAQFYSVAAFGRRLPEASLTGSVGTRGDVTGGRSVSYSDSVIAAYAREIASDKIAHVATLRALLNKAGATIMVAQPAINIDGGTSGAFSAAARLAGIVDKSVGTFDPYLSDENFLLAAFFIADLTVTALKGVAALSYDDLERVNLEPLLGVLAADSHHAGLIRSELVLRGPNAQATANRISAARDVLDGGSVMDAGVALTDGRVITAPRDSNGVAWSRSSIQVHNIVYLRNDSASSGGFFPAGTNNSNSSLTLSSKLG